MDADILRRACQGDEEAVEALVTAHQEAVFRLAYLITGDADDAQDVAQETFLAALRALPRFDSTRPLRPWLLRIAANTARNRRRSLGRYWGALRRLVVAVPEPVAHVEALAAQHWEAQALWEAVRRLNRADQEVIYLRCFLELSISETAHALAIEEGTVKSRLSRALGRLRGVVTREFPLLSEGRQP